MTNIQNADDYGCFKWSIVTYLNATNLNPTTFEKADKDFTKKLDFKDIKFPVKIRDTLKSEKKFSISIRVFGYQNKEKHTI